MEMELVSGLLVEWVEFDPPHYAFSTTFTLKNTEAPPLRYA